jgi:glutamyl-tRNA synthetase
VITRFAPSPTGSLHIGGVRTAIYNWLYSRHNKGKFLLRIEDTDKERSTEHSVHEIIEGLQWIGIDWDMEPVRQSSRLDIYQNIADLLIEQGNAYRCYCSLDEIEQKRKVYKEKGLIYRYERTCRNKGLIEGKEYAVRLNVPEKTQIETYDLLRGNIVYDCSEIDDFVILKRDGYPTYNFAVVIDDHDMGITDIIRGDDHLSNTPKQVILYNLLNYSPPRFAHVSMILGQDKSKLSKRHGATSITAYKEDGYLPESLLNFLVRLGWSYGDKEIFSKEELIELFNLKNLGKTPAIFNKDKLTWLNSHYIKNVSTDYLTEYSKPFYRAKGIDINKVTPLQFDKIINIFRERIQTIKEYPDISKYFFDDVKEFDINADNKYLNIETLPILKKIEEEIQKLQEFDIENLHTSFNKIMTELDLKLGKIAQPLRVALTGGTASPGIFEVMEIMGRELTLKRLQYAIEHIHSKQL